MEPGRIAKSVLIIDEAQDMDEQVYALLQVLMDYNEEMRVIRGSSAKYLQKFMEEKRQLSTSFWKTTAAKVIWYILPISLQP